MKTENSKKGNRVVHLCIDLEGVRGWNNKDLERLFTSGGEKLTAKEIREWIDEQLAKNIRVIPYGERCDNFDDVKGCMGHVGEPLLT